LESGTGYPFSSFPSESCIQLFLREEWFLSLFRLPITPLGTVQLSLPCPLSLGQGRWSISRPPGFSVLWWFADYFSILRYCLTLDVAHWLRRWTLWTATCLISGSSLLTTSCWPFCLSSLCLLKVPVEISSLLSATPPLCCVLLLSSLFIVQFSLCVCVCGGGGEGQSAQGAMLVYSRGGWGILQYCVMLGAHLLVCQMSIKQVWSQHLVVVRALLFSQCNVARRSFPWARGSGCRSFDSPWCFISVKCGSSISARFLIHGAHAVCFCALVAILDPLYQHFEVCGTFTFSVFKLQKHSL
jgi:hypothetical protein